MDFSKLSDYLNRLPREGVPGCEMVVWKDHREVFRHTAGEAKGGETYWLYSVTKVLTMTVTMQLIEKGMLRLSDPVAAYLPAFSHLTVQDGETVRPAKTMLTLEHLMAMQGGLDYDLAAPAIRRKIRESGGDAGTVEMVNCFAEKPLLFDPGQGFKYSLCHDVVGAIVEVIAGKPLSTVAKENVLDPLGIRTLTFHPDAEQLAKLAPQYTVNADMKTVPIANCRDSLASMPHYDSGGSGLMGDAEGYILLADALANNGVGKNGNRILTGASIDDMRRNRQHGASWTDWVKVKHKRGYGYGLGVRTLMDAAASRSPIGEFGWDGATGAWAMMDPDNHIGAFYVQHVLNMNRAYYEFHPAIRDLLYESLA
ncbi:MAG: serine hydrolase [Clostridia bacterium]|nr:serine hydrolase [Clostridia bacterium]